jgi:4-diphosphocytidyl-2-C-methyl-D-erythritol kinase
MEKLFKSPAKVNLVLNVIGEREDGYHLIESLMCKVSLFDIVKISILQGKNSSRIEVKCPGRPELEGERNLAYKAAKQLLETYKVDANIAISIEKNIPVGGGLGGGSSNAATVLKGLNELLKLNVNNEALATIGAKLGADVPFFIYDGTCLVEGIGEKVTPLKNFPRFHLVIVSPGFGIPTASVYKMIKGGLTNSVLSGIKDASSGNEVVFPLIGNDLDRFASRLRPELGQIKELLVAAGAMKAIVSGSGSSVFGIFENQDKVRAGADFVRKRAGNLNKSIGEIRVFEVTTQG